MSKHPLGEVFGFPISNQSDEAQRYRKGRLCPYNNKVPNCTKDKKDNPLGVCSVLDKNGELVITCPVRFRQDWIIAEQAAGFFFSEGAKWASLTEVRLNDADGKSAGNVDVVLVSYDTQGRIMDFGSLEVQAVYISGNVRKPFEFFMENPSGHRTMDWSGQKGYPRADYLSSSRKRLVPQMLSKGSIFKSWGKKQAVALHTSFFNTLPELPQVALQDAEVAWFLYDLKMDQVHQIYRLTHTKTVYTKFEPALEKITAANPGELEGFVRNIQGKLNHVLSR